MRIILLVLDGLGVGEMPDVSEVRPQDKGADTLAAVVRQVGLRRWDNLLNLGLGCAAGLSGEAQVSAPLASYGRSRLAHDGADSYLGHQEIMGTIPKPPVKTFLSEVAGALERELRAKGHRVSRPIIGSSLLLVDEAVVIGDNLEADPGLNINLTVAADLIDFDQALQIGLVVRRALHVARVIVFGGPGISTEDILQHVEQRANGQTGVDSPSLGVYDEHLRVQHLGYGVDPERQAASILSRLGMQVVLIGKMADLIVCPGADRASIVPTSQVMQALFDAYRRIGIGLVAATVQETDLACHEGDALRVAAVLEEVDRGLALLLPELVEEDVLIICADHGNDPRLNVGLHTREETPLLIYQKGRPAHPLGSRDTLADIGFTITHLFDAPPTQDGSSIVDRRDT